jgi:nucleotide-binding universal stress UspA family protein
MAAERTIVVGVDGSPASIDALSWAVRQATATDAAVEAICAWESPSLAEVTPTGGIPPIVHQPMVDVTVLEGVQRRLDEVIESAVGSSASQGEVPIAAKVIEGHPAHVLVQAAERAELLVVGKSAHGAIVGMLLGSVSSDVTAHAPCPVVVVPGRAPGQQAGHDMPDEDPASTKRSEAR